MTTQDMEMQKDNKLTFVVLLINKIGFAKRVPINLNLVSL